MKDAFYFSHDSNAHTDPKLAALISKFGYEGYGLWWTIIELMHQQNDGKFEKFPGLFKGLAFTLKQNEAMLEALFSASIHEFYLLKEDDNFIWSERVVRNLKKRAEKRAKKAEAGRLGGLASGNSRSKTKQNEAMLEANEAKERKGKERIIYRPSLDDVRAYCAERNNGVDPEKWFNHYEANGWKVGRNPMKDWQAAVRTWEGSRNGDKPIREVIG